MVDIRAAVPGDVPSVADRMRAADVAEGRAAGITDLRGALHEGRTRSTWCLTAVADRPVAMFGVRPWQDDALTLTGVPWFIGTDDLVAHRRAFNRLAPDYIVRMLRAYPRLMNRVHARNTAAVAWLARVGFTVHPPHAHPATGEPFHWFTKEA